MANLTTELKIGRCDMELIFYKWGTDIMLSNK